MKIIVLAMTGASGAVYGLKLGKELLNIGVRLTILISSTGFQVIREETGLDLKGDNGDVQQALEAHLRPAPGRLDYFSEDDFFAPVASGSSAPDAMVICPCSMGTLSRIACGNSRTLLERCADAGDCAQHPASPGGRGDQYHGESQSAGVERAEVQRGQRRAGKSGDVPGD